MRKVLLWSLFFVAMAASVPVPAATATDFYTDLLRRGVADVEAGRNDAAVTPLRIAAFGLVDSIEHYETAQAYLVIAFDRLNQPEEAREAANRLLAAERVERKFASLRLPESIRTSFTTAARKFLPAAEIATLTTAPAAPRSPVTTPPQPQTSSKAPQGDTPKKPLGDEPKKIVEEPKKPVEKPAPVQPPPAAAQVKPATTTTTTPPAPRPAPVQPAKPVVDVPARLAAGERALVAANLADARKAYRELLDAGGHDHMTWIRVAEGLYRSRDFTGALSAFQRVGPLRPGEEAYRYYIAVASYETGQYENARRELAAALPFIEITPDVQRYRAKIEGAR